MSQENIYQTMESAITECSTECGMDSGLAASLTSGIIQRMQILCGGNTEYFPKRVHRLNQLHISDTERRPVPVFVSKKDRDAAIKRDFTGANFEELGKKYRCSPRTVRRAVDEKRERTDSPG